MYSTGKDSTSDRGSKSKRRKVRRAQSLSPVNQRKNGRSKTHEPRERIIRARSQTQLKEIAPSQNRPKTIIVYENEGAGKDKTGSKKESTVKRGKSKNVSEKPKDKSKESASEKKKSEKKIDSKKPSSVSKKKKKMKTSETDKTKEQQVDKNNTTKTSNPDGEKEQISTEREVEPTIKGKVNTRQLLK